MDDSLTDLLSSFQGAVSIVTSTLDPSGPHPRLSQYKFKREGFADQESRRKKALEEQKFRRKDFTDHARRIVEGELLSDDENDMDEGSYDEIDSSTEMAAAGSKQKHRVKAPYRNQLMLSEWLVDVPSDFQENWYVVVCPLAKRCLVISAKGVTTAYSRSGHMMQSFPSHLPSGCRKMMHRGSGYCILDCLFDSVSSTFYILDIMCWTGHPVYDSDTEFRFYWLRAKLSEWDLDLSVHCRTNPYKFIPLQYHECSSAVLLEILNSPWPVAVDGLMFFHKRVQYCLGRTPLVTWLKPQMVHEVLGIPVSREFLDCAPVLSDVKMETEKRQTQKQSMDVSEMTEDQSQTDQINEQ